MKEKALFKIPITDKIVLPGLAGIAGTLVMYSVGLPLYFLKITKVLYLFYTIELFITPELSRTLPGFVAGFFAGIIVGVILTFFFKLFIEWTGSDWLWAKTAFYGAAIWFIWVGLARDFMDLTPYLFKDLQSNVVLFVQSQIFSFAATYFLIKIAGSKEALQSEGGLK